MARKALPRNVMRRAVENRNIEDFIWACLDLCCVELKKEEKTSTFSGRDIQAFLDHLIKIDKEKKERGETQGSEKDNKNLMELDAWVKKAR